MVRQIYRQAALDRLASPDRLDRPYRLVSPRGALAVFALIGALVFGVGWALVSKASVKVPARGIVLQKEGLLEITSDHAGRVQQLLIKPGDTIAAGAPVATFQRSDLLREIATVRAELEDAVARERNRQEFFRAQDDRETRAERERLSSTEKTKAAVDRRIQLYQRRLDELTSLAERKIVTGTTVIDAEVELANARERLQQLNTGALEIKLKARERRNRQEVALFDERMKIDALERRMKRLAEQFEERRHVRSPYEGMVVEVKVARGDVVASGTALATIAPRAGDDDLAIGVVYVTPRDGKRILKGMPAEVVPSLYRKQEFGFIRGEVAFVSSVPSTAEGMRAILRNEQLVSQFASGEAPFEVRIAFKRDPATSSGLAWSSSQGPNAEVGPGTLLDAAILVGRVPIADLVFPGLAQTIGVAGDE